MLHCLILSLVVFNLLSAESKYPQAKVSFDDFDALVSEVKPHREARLVDLDTFLEMAKMENVIILDSRSKHRYDRIHLKGAKHLNFADFTQTSLAQVIPSFDTTVLIYCNNNFEGNQTDFATKMVFVPSSIPISISSSSPPLSKASSSSLPSLNNTDPSRQFAIQEKPLMMALNVPTYINLYGYGYRNVYELHELVDVKDPRVEFEGSIVSKP